MTEFFFDGEDTGDSQSTSGPTGSVEPMIEEEEENIGESTIESGSSTTGSIGGGSDTPGSSTTGSIGGGSMVEGEENEDKEEPQQQPTTVNDEESILNPKYVEKVKQSQFGELYSRLVSDEKESQCAEFLAPQLIKQDRLYTHSFNATFGSFY